MKTRTIFSESEWSTLADDFSISPRQQDILRHVFSGLGDKETAVCLNISIHTVRTHLYRLYEKLGVHDRHGLMLEVFARARDKCRKIRCPLLS